MKVEGPDRFTITIHAGGSPPFDIRDADGATKFSGRATSKLPKLYVVTAAGDIIYVGITKQSMRPRLRLGWQETGQKGYHGYPWRHHHTEATLDNWYQMMPAAISSLLDIETVEAEVVYLIRQKGQWPAYQTEIHFHASSDEHRAVASHSFEHYA